MALRRLLTARRGPEFERLFAAARFNTGNASAPGFTVNVSLTLTGGAASAQRNISVGGATAVVTLSMTVGAASGQGSTALPGFTATVAVSMTGGAASAQRNMAAPGSVIPVTLSMTGGAASAQRNISVGGQTVAANLSVIGGAVTIGGAFQRMLRPRRAVTTLNRLFVGAYTGSRPAFGDMEWVGDAFTTVIGAVTASGSASLSGGTFPGAVLPVTVTMSPGAVTAEQNVSASGGLMTVAVSLASGLVSISADAAASELITRMRRRLSR